MFLRDLYQSYGDVPRVKFRHLAKTERNAEIIRRRRNGETPSLLAREFGITVQRVWYIVRRQAANGEK
jgi:hypothetical protein